MPDDAEDEDVVVVPETPGHVQPAAAYLAFSSKASRHPAVQTMGVRLGFRAVPGWSSLRALAPAGDGAITKQLLAPRSRSPVARTRALHALTRAIPSAALDRTGKYLMLAVAEPSSVKVELDQRLSPGWQLGIYLGNSTNRGRTALQAFEGGVVRFIAKVVSEPDGRAQLDAEADCLADLERVPGLTGTVPRVLARVSRRTTEALITDAFAGAPSPSSLSGGLRDWLNRCQWGEARPFRDSSIVGRVVAAADESGMRRLSTAALERLADAPVPRTVVHGDFVPWNIRMTAQGPAVFDWEYGLLDGVPGWDALFFIAQVGVIQRGWDAPTLAGALTGISPTTRRLSSNQSQALSVLVLVDLAARYARRGDAWRAELTRTAAELMHATSLSRSRLAHRVGAAAASRRAR